MAFFDEAVEAGGERLVVRCGYADPTVTRVHRVGFWPFRRR
ncbi:MAG: hypothetical protein ACREWE_06675 [Gammaproteobacteria bacterium]